MAREIPSAKRLQVVRLYFEGDSYDEIAGKLGVAKSSVAAIIQGVKEGQFPQLEGVAGMVDELRGLAVGLRKARMEPTEASLLFILMKRLLELGVDPGLLEGWVRMCRTIPAGELPGSSLIRAASRLAKLEEEGLTYDEAVEKLRSAAAELRGLEQKTAALRQEQSRLEGESASLTERCRTLGEERKQQEAERKATEEAVRSLSARRDTLTKQAQQREAELSRLERRHEDLSRVVPQLEGRKEALEKEVASRAQTLSVLEGLGFSRDQMEKLKDSLREMAERHPGEEVAARFFQCLSSYDSLLALEAQREQLAADVEKLARQRDSLSRLGERQGLSADEVVEGIATVKSLLQKGVPLAAVASYQRQLSTAGVDHQSFQKLVEEFGALSKAVAARGKELARIDEEIGKRGQAFRQLQAEEARLKESITTLRDSGLKEIQQMASSAAVMVEKLGQDLREDITGWGEVRAEVGKWKEELKVARYFTKLPLSQEALSSLVDDISGQVVLQYLSIALSWCQKKSNPKLRPPAMIAKKYYRIAEYTEVELADIITWAILLLVEGMGSERE